ncbi:MAG TPA: phage virion morphogenesis protein [Reyranella sp.]|nr:phage virion morphogenesis protein [Reyranella sp.]
MSGLEMKFELEDAALERALKELVDRGGDLQPAFKDIGADMLLVTSRAFNLSRSPEGVPWPPSAAALAEGRQTLIDTRNLRDHFSYVTSPTGVVYGTNVPYAGYLQTGYEFIHEGKANQADPRAYAQALMESVVTVPAREFVGASAQDIKRWELTLADYLSGETGGAPA